MKKPTITINKKEGVYAEVLWADEGGPINLTGRTVEVTEAYPPELADGQVDITDPEAGKCRLILDPPVSQHLQLGTANWFRLGLLLPNGRWDTTPKIWINVE